MDKRSKYDMEEEIHFRKIPKHKNRKKWLITIKR